VCGSGRATPYLHHTLSDKHKDIFNQYNVIWHKYRGRIEEKKRAANLILWHVFVLIAPFILQKQVEITPYL